MDQEHRSRTLSVPDWFPDWHLVRPDDVARLAELAGRPAVAAGLLSMHPSGYVREAAVSVLATTDEMNALPFLLVRSADWVEPVRCSAQAALRARLERTRPEDLLLAAPLLQQMAAETGRANEFASEVLDSLRTSVHSSTLLAGLAHDSYRVRRQCARFLVERGEASMATFAIAVRQDDAVTTRFVGTAAVDQEPDTDSMIGALWGSSIASLKALALYRYQSSGSPKALAASEDGLFHRAASVRFLAQRYLAQHGVNVVRRYRDASPRQVIALQGIAEVGEARDAEAITPYLDDVRVRARLHAVQAVGRLLEAKSRPLILAKLDDPSPAVVKAAGRVLARQQLDPATLNQIWDQTAATEIEALRRAAFCVFMQQSRWPKLVLACRSIISRDDDLRRRGGLLLKSAMDSWNNSSTRPSEAQIEELTTLEPIVGRVSSAVQRELLDLLKHAR